MFDLINKLFQTIDGFNRGLNTIEEVIEVKDELRSHACQKWGSILHEEAWKMVSATEGSWYFPTEGELDFVGHVKARRKARRLL